VSDSHSDVSKFRSESTCAYRFWPNVPSAQSAATPDAPERITFGTLFRGPDPILTPAPSSRHHATALMTMLDATQSQTPMHPVSATAYGPQRSNNPFGFGKAWHRIEKKARWTPVAFRD
jgi:hypothetical protein